MNDLDITRLRVYLVAPDVTPPYRWTGTCKPSPVYYNIVRLTTACGIEGASGVLSGDYYEEQDQYDDPEDFDESLIEIALWDATVDEMAYFLEQFQLLHS